MSSHIDRRTFLLKSARIIPVAYTAQAIASDAQPAPAPENGLGSTPESVGRKLVSAFDYRGVRLLPSRWLDQIQSARDFYLGVANDDILYGFRVAAGLVAPGKPLGGWAAENSNVIFGQWLSGMARLYAATADHALRDKAEFLLTEWNQTIGEDGNCRMSLYAFDKLICGLVDMHRYAGSSSALSVVRKVMPWAMQTFSRDRIPGRRDLLNGRPSEWYTFAENLYRVYQVTGDPAYHRFAASYHYSSFWEKFAENTAPENAFHVHAYSHVNTFSSAAKAYEVTGDKRYLEILRNAYDFLQDTQCYATGGFGPAERLVPADGTLGRSLEARNASFETVCGSWAGFKMARYLTEFTGEARYGDWMERLFYNGVGSALPIQQGGEHFYYSDYRVTGGLKVYKVSRYSCCSGSYIQCLADYHNLIYYHDREALYVNLFVPSEVVWQGPIGEVNLVQETDYPATESVMWRLTLENPQHFSLRFRVPQWTDHPSIRINGNASSIAAEPGTWATIDREWQSGDTVDLRIPLRLRMLPVDPQHPRRVVVVRGPVVLVMDDWVFEDIPRLPEPGDVEQWLQPDPEQPGVFQIKPPDGTTVQARFRPFYTIGEVVPYRMYHDLDVLPIPMW